MLLVLVDPCYAAISRSLHVADCRDRGAAEVYAWLSRSIFKLWQAPDGALHRLLPEGDESTPCPCTPEGQQQSYSMYAT